MTNNKQTQTQPTGELVLRTIAMPKDTNANGDIFGGWLVSQMDVGGAIRARQASHTRVVTVAIDKIVFHSPVYVGDIICCYADIEKIGNSSMVINMQVWALAQETTERRMVTEGVFVFVAIDENGRPCPVNRD